MSEQNIVFLGLLASSKSLAEFFVWEGFLAVKQGKITKTGTIDEYKTLTLSGIFDGFKTVKLRDGQFIMPGFVDCHTHAPQFPNLGLGLDRPLLEWLEKYTFPLEIQYSDVEFAANVYDIVVQRLLTNGTTTSCYFGSLHFDGTLELVKSVVKHGQRALVGKVSMNVENDAGYYNDTEKEIQEAETFVQKVLEYKNDLIEPIVTPRFAISCDRELLIALAEIARKYNCRTQSHLSENLSEIEYVLELFPDCKTYTDVYDKTGILNEKCIMAHSIYLSGEEIKTLSDRQVSIAHCPASNTRLKSGLCPVRNYINNNIKVGLGTDVSGGDNASILDAMRRTMDVSTHLEMNDHDGYSINWKEAFYLSTLGGAIALGLDKKIGSFDVGKDFDALLVDVYANGSAIDNYHTEDGEEHAIGLVQRFVYLGDDRNILQVYVKGHKVKDIM